MQHAQLTHAIETADFVQFRAVALLYLQARGYTAELTDGTDDGGVDIKLLHLPPNPDYHPVQISTEKDWRKKVREDAQKVRKKLSRSRLLFVSSRRIPEVEFDALAHEIEREHGVVVTRADAQGIASVALTHGIASKVLACVGIPVPEVSAPLRPPDLREEVAYAYAFFADEPDQFRRGVIERAVLTAVATAGGAAPRERVTDEVCLALRLTANQRALVRAAIDRMIQAGRVVGPNGTLRVTDAAVDGERSLRALRDEERGRLRARVDQELERWIHHASRRDTLVASIENDLGALALDAASIAAQTVARERGAEALLRDRLQRVRGQLALFIDAEEDQRAALAALAAVVGRSPFARAMAAGETFLRLTALDASQLLSAFGGHVRIAVALDTSVAMPLLCAKLYEPAGRRLVLAAADLYEQLIAHGVEVILPRDYLEETAQHLLTAWADYRDIVDLDPDLRGSENVFVAHYAALRHAGVAPTGDREAEGPFQRYLAGFGFVAGAAGDPSRARDALMGKLGRWFERYHVHPRDLRPSEASRRAVEEDVSWLQRGDDATQRPRILTDHDIRTMAWLHDQERDHGVLHVLCSWDRLLGRVRERSGASWEALDPVAFTDTLALVASARRDFSLVSPVSVALSLNDDTVQRGAEVWDFLAKNARAALHDAAFQQQALAFKQDWVARATRDPRRSMQQDWDDWKARHLPARGP